MDLLGRCRGGQRPNLVHEREHVAVLCDLNDPAILDSDQIPRDEFHIAARPWHAGEFSLMRALIAHPGADKVVLCDGVSNLGTEVGEGLPEAGDRLLELGEIGPGAGVPLQIWRADVVELFHCALIDDLVEALEYGLQVFHPKLPSSLPPVTNRITIALADAGSMGKSPYLGADSLGRWMEAKAAASVWFPNPSFVRMLLKWWPAVLTLMKRRSAISPLENPFATRRKTSISRFVNSSRFFGPVLPRTLSSLRKAAAASASGIAPNRSNAASAARASEIASGRSVSRSVRASPRRARHAPNAMPASLKATAEARRAVDASGSPLAASTFPLAKSASPACRLLFVTAATPSMA